MSIVVGKRDSQLLHAVCVHAWNVLGHDELEVSVYQDTVVVVRGWERFYFTRDARAPGGWRASHAVVATKPPAPLDWAPPRGSSPKAVADAIVAAVRAHPPERTTP